VSTATDYSKAAQEQALAAIKQSQDLAVAGVELWAKSVEPFVAKTLPLPYPSELPTPAQLIADAFGYAEQLLAAQKQFAERVAAASAPLRTAAEKASAAK
jgi:hypothetical protein